MIDCVGVVVYIVPADAALRAPADIIPPIFTDGVVHHLISQISFFLFRRHKQVDDSGGPSWAA